MDFKHNTTNLENEVEDELERLTLKLQELKNKREIERYRERQEKERIEALLTEEKRKAEQENKERYRERQEKERIEALLKEEKQKAEQENKERYRERQEKERIEAFLREEKEREKRKMEALLREAKRKAEEENKERYREKQEKERIEALLREEKQRIETENELRILQEKQLEKERIAKREDHFNNLFENINNSIRGKHNQLNSSPVDYTNVLKSFGFSLVEMHNSSRLGDCVDRVKMLPEHIKNTHLEKLKNSAWDNRYEIYKNDNKTYIVGCQRCLKFWDHECVCAVYLKYDL